MIFQRNVKLSALLFAVGFALSLTLPSVAFALNEAPRTFTLDGRIFNSPTSSTPLLGAVTINVKILDPSGTCVLYEESQPFNTTATKGYFNVPVGSPASDAKRVGDDPNHTMETVYQNKALITAVNAGCGGGYTPSAGDSRLVRVTVTPVATGIAQVFSPDMRLDAVPTAVVAESIQGLSRDNMLELNTNVELTQANIENVFSVANYPVLTSLLAGTSSLYMKASPSAAVSFNGQQITNVAAPTLGTDATNKTYVDSNIGGKAADTVVFAGIAAGDAGKVMVWDGTKWTAAAQAGDATKLPLAGGTMTGAINMGSQNLLATGHITMSTQTTLNLGTYTNAQETVLALGLGAPDAGKFWYNSDLPGLKVWNGSAAIAVQQSGSAAGGDLTGTYPNPTIAANAVVASKINDGAVTGAKILDATITGSDIANSTITDVNIAGVGAGKITSGAGVYFTYAPNNTPCADGQYMRWDNTNTRWVCGTPIDTGITALTGDVTASGSGSVAATISNLAVTNTKLAALAVTDAKVNDVSYSKLSNGAGVYLNYMPNNTACADGQILSWDNTNTRWVCASGAVGSVVGVATGTGLTGGTITSSGTISIATGGVGTTELANNAVTAAKLNDDAVTSTKILDGTIATIDIADNAITENKINSGAVTTPKLFANPGANYLVMTDGVAGSTLVAKSCAVGEVLKWTITGWICSADNNAGGTVTSFATGTGLAGGPISTTGTISIAAGGVGTTELAANAVTNAKLNDDAVTSAKILDGTIATQDIAANAVTSVLINALAVTDAKINDVGIDKLVYANGKYFSYRPNGVACADGEVITWDNANSRWVCGSPSAGSVTSIATGTGLTGGPINSTGTIGIAPGGVSSTELAANAVTNAKLNDGAVDSAKILDGTIATQDIAAKAITTALINDSAVTALQLNTDAVTSAKILDGTIGLADLSAAITNGLWTANGGNVYRSSGNVGIGTTAPANVLDVNVGGGDVSITGNTFSGSNGIFLSNTSGSNQVWQLSAIGSTAPYAPAKGFMIRDGTAGATRFVITTTGLTGIGATAPNSVLTVGGVTALGETTAPTLTAGYGKLYVKSADSKLYFMDDSGLEKNISDSAAGGTVTTVATGTGLTGGPIGTAGTISIATGGVGTTELANSSVTNAKLNDGAVDSAKILDGTIATQDINGKAITTALINDSAVTALQLNDDAVTSAKILDGTIALADLSTAITDGLWTASSGNVYRSSGNVGIGTTAPDSTFEVVSNSTADGSVAFDYSVNHTGSAMWSSVVGSKLAVSTLGASTNQMATGSQITVSSSGSSPTLRGQDIIASSTGTGGHVTGLNVSATSATTTVTTNNVTGATILASAANTGGGSTVNLIGLSVNANSSNNVGSAYGIQGKVNISAGTTNWAQGGVFQARSTGGTIGEGYGVYIDDTIATVSYGLYQAGTNDNNYFGGSVGIGITNPNSKLTVNGVTALGETVAPGATAGYGKLYVKSSDSKLYFMDDSGLEKNISDSAAGGTVTTVATGTGLTGGPIGTTGTISIATGGVSSTELASNAVINAKINDGAVDSAKILDGTIATADINANAITTALINDSAVTALQLNNDAVTSAKILDGTIGLADLSTAITDGLWTANSGNVYRSSGNVGIGTTAPTTPLQIIGKTTSTSFEATTGTAADPAIDLNGSNYGFYENAGFITMTHNGVASWSFGSQYIQSGSGSGARMSSASSVSEVSYGFRSDHDTGIYSPASENVAIVTNGAERVRVNASGFGIGTTVPNSLLTVNGVTALGETAAPGATAGYGKLYVKSADSKLYFMDDSGLEKNISDSAAGGTVTGIATGTGLSGGPIGTTGTISIATGGVSSTELASNAVINAKINDGAVDSAKILDGTIATADINANAITTALINDSAVTALQLNNDAVTSAKILDGTIALADLSTAITDGLWTANGGNVYRSSGNVGIGTTAPTATLQVSGAGSFGSSGNKFGTSPLTVNISTGENAVVLKSNNVGITQMIQGVDSTNTTQFLLDVGNSSYILGSVGIGTTTQVAKLSVAGVTALGETAAPGATAGYGKLYVKSSDSKLYFMDDSGAETDLLAAGGPGTVTAVAAGTGLTGGPITSNGTLSIASNAITSALLNDAAVTNAKLNDGAVDSAKILDGTIATQDIAAKAITTALINDSAVTALQLNDDAVTSAKILDGTIALADLSTAITDGLWTANGGNVYRSTGSVGVGTTAPWQKFTVGNPGTSEDTLASFGLSSANGRVDLGLTGWHGRLDIYNHSNTKSVSINSAGNSYITGGSVAIGITNPNSATKLHLHSGYFGGTQSSTASQLVLESNSHAALTFQTPDTATQNIYFRDASDAAGNVSGYIRYDHNDNSLAFATAGAKRLSLSSSGQLAVGTNPTAVGILTVEGVTALRETTAPSLTANYGKLYVKSSDSKLYFMDDSGAETDLLAAGGPGTVTAVAAGTGLTGGPITSNGTLSIAGGGVGTTELASNAVTNAKLNDGAVDSAKILDGTIATQDLAAKAITTALINDSAVTALQLNSDAVTSAKILDGTIALADLSSAITDGLWTASGGNVYRSSGNVGIGTTAPGYPLDIGSNVIGYAARMAGALQVNSNNSGNSLLVTESGSAKLAVFQQGGSDRAYIANNGGAWFGNSVGIGTTSNSMLTVSGVTALGETTAPTSTSGYGKLYVKSSDSKLYFMDDSGAETDLLAAGGPGTVTAVAAGTGLTGGPITSNGTLSIASNAITTALLNDAAVTNAKLNDGAVDSAKILDGTIATQDIAAKAITTSLINDSAVTTLQLNADAVTSAKILDGTIATADIANNAIVAALINDSAVTTAKIASAAVTDAKINDVSYNKLSNASGVYLTYKPNETACSDGQFLTWDNANARWVCGTASAGGVTGIAAGTGLTGGPITSNGTLSIANNAITNALLNDAAVTASKINTDAVTSTGILDGAIMAADLNSTIANGLWSVNGSDVYRASGNVGIGTTAPTSKLEVTRVITTPLGGSQVNAITGIITASPSSNSSDYHTGLYGMATGIGANNVGSLAGVNGIVNSGDLGTYLYGGLFNAQKNNGDVLTGGAFGVYAQTDVASSTTPLNVGGQFIAASTLSGTVTESVGVWAKSSKHNSSTITSAYGVRSEVYLSGSGNISTAYGNHILLDDAGTGAIVTGYGLYIADVIATNAWGIYQVGSNDQNYFGGSVGIGTTVPNSSLTVNGITALGETTAPTATANYGKLYVKSSDSKLYFMDDSGAETDLLAAGGSGTVTAVAAGTGLTGGPITSNGTLSIASNAITSALLNDAAVTNAKLNDDAVDSVTILDGTIATADINAKAITTALINDSAITSLQLNDAAVTASKINTGAVNSTGILDGAIVAADLNSAIANGLWSVNGANIYRASGKVGIGLTNPAGIFEVQGGTAGAGTNGSGIELVAQSGGTGNTNGGSISLTTGWESGNGTSGRIMVFGPGNQPTGDFALLGVSTMVNTYAYNPSSTVIGVDSGPYWYTTATGASASLVGIRGKPTTAGASFQGALVGVQGKPYYNYDGTISSAIGLEGNVLNSNDGDITIAKAGDFSITNSSTGAVATGYGVYVGNVQATNKWSVFASDATAKNYFAATVGVGTTAANSLLTVNGVTALGETTAPSLTAGYGKLYVKSSDSKLYFMDDSGAETDLLAAGGPGTVTAVAAGTGLTGGPITSNGTLSIANNAITSALLNDAAVTNAKLNDGAVDSAKILDGTIATQDIATKAITTALINDSAVTTLQLNDAAVTASKINAGAVTSTGILDGAIVAADLNSAIANGLWSVNGANIYRATGSVGIGTTNIGQASLEVSTSGSMQDAVRANSSRANGNNLGFSANLNPTHTGVGIYTDTGITANIASKLSVASSNMGSATAVIANNVRNATTTGDSGVLLEQTGVSIRYGHGTNDLSATPTTGISYGMYVLPQHGRGTISHMYDIYLDLPVTGGTATNRYGIYQANSAKNYFGGNVGIGTSAPNSLLSVNGVMSLGETTAPALTSGYGKLYVKSSDSKLYFMDDSGAETDLLASSGITGIATGTGLTGGPISGTGTLSIASNAITNALLNDDAVTSAKILDGTIAATDLATAVANGLWSGDGTHVYRTGGRVGIGTTDPIDLLHLNTGSASTISTRFSNSTTGATVTDGLTIGINSIGAGFIWQSENSYLQFGTSNAERMRVDASGNVGIGTTNPTYKLDVTGDIRATATLRAGNGSVGAPSITFANEADTGLFNGGGGSDILGFATGGVERMRIDASGNIGIGTTSPTQKLSVTGSFTAGSAASALLSVGKGSAESVSIENGVASKEALRIYAVGGQTAPILNVGNSNLSSSYLAVAASGNVGLGTTSPNSVLTVSGVTALGETTAPSLTAGYGKLYVKSSDSKLYFMDDSGAETDLLASSGITGIATGTGLTGGPISGTGTLSIASNAITNALLNDDAVTSAKILDGTIAATDLATAVANGLWSGNGTNVYRASGNVGVGTTAPGDLLSLSGSSNPTFSIRDTNANTGSRTLGTIDFGSGNGKWAGIRGLITGGFDDVSALGFYTTASGGSQTERMRIDTNGKLGLGVTNPSHHIHARLNQNAQTAVAVENQTAGAAAQAVHASYNNLGNYANFGITSSTYSAGGTAYPVDGAYINTNSGNGFGIIVNSAASFRVYTNGNDASNERLRVTSAGNVGIGTTSPVSKLEVNGTITATAFSGPMTSSVVGAGVGSASAPSLSFSGDTNTGFYNASSNDTISIAANSANIFNISSAGIVSATNGGGLVTTANGVVGAPTYAFAGDANTGMWSPLADTVAFSTNGAERLRVNSSGYVGIGTTNPTVALDVVGDIQYTGSLLDVSDRRLKHDIQPLEGALDKLGNIRGVSFRMNNNPDLKEDGVIAQEVEPYFPELVKTKNDEMKSKSVNYIGFIGWLIEAVKELKAQIAALTADQDAKYQELVEKLEQENKAKEQRIQALEERLLKIEQNMNEAKDRAPANK